MDAAVGLVQAYLRLNGYFTETEYPIVASRRGLPVALTDLDLLAIRFPGAAHWVPQGSGGMSLDTDPLLDVTNDRMDMIIAEVKEGRARLNPAARSPAVLESVIRRFGCCFEDPHGAADAILRGRTAETQLRHGSNCRVRMVVFSGGGYEKETSQFVTISLRHVVRFVSEHIHAHEDVFLSCSLKDDTLALLALLAKLGFRFE